MSFRIPARRDTATMNDTDYIAKSGTLTFAPGETTKTITIEVKGDSKKEANPGAPGLSLDLFGIAALPPLFVDQTWAREDGSSVFPWYLGHL